MDDVKLRLSAQRALLGAVPACLRAVSVELRGTVLHFRATFEREPTEDERDLLSTASTEIIADHPEVTTADEEYLVLPPPAQPQHLAHVVFLRAE